MVVEAGIQAASIGIPDTMLLMLLALVVFGPRRLPEIGRQIGKLMYEFRKVSNEFKYQMEEELRASEEAERQKKLESAMAAKPATLDIPPHPVSEAAPLELSAGTDAATETAGDSVASAEGEVPASDVPTSEELAQSPTPQPAASGPVEIQPPATGEVVAARRPFRQAPASLASEDVVTESGAEPERSTDARVEVADEGRTGSELQPGVSSADAPHNLRSRQEAHHG